MCVHFRLRLRKGLLRRTDAEDCPLHIGCQDILHLQLAEVAVIGTSTPALGTGKAAAGKDTAP